WSTWRSYVGSSTTLLHRCASRQNTSGHKIGVEMHSALSKHHERQVEIKQKAGEFWQEHEYVFCTPLGTHIHPGHDILEEFKKLLERAGLPDIRFHDLRHSAATMLLSVGVHPKVILVAKSIFTLAIQRIQAQNEHHF